MNVSVFLNFSVMRKSPCNVEEAKVERRQHMRYAVDALVEVLVADGSLLFRGRGLDISVAVSGARTSP